MMKFWKSEITVYSQRDKRKEVYCLVLGDYDDFEDAQEMQKIVYEKNLIFAPIIPFNTITNTFIETVSPLRE